MSRPRHKPSCLCVECKAVRELRYIDHGCPCGTTDYFGRHLHRLLRSYRQAMRTMADMTDGKRANEMHTDTAARQSDGWVASHRLVAKWRAGR